MEKNKIKINICGYDFSVVTDEDKHYMANIAGKVERKVNKMLEANSRLSTAAAALFAAMDYCDQVQKANGDGDNLRDQLKDYLEESGNARKQLDESKKEIERLKREVAALRRRIAAEDGTLIDEKKAKDTKSENAPIPGFFSEDAFAESADASAEILSFFEQKSFEDED